MSEIHLRQRFGLCETGYQVRRVSQIFYTCIDFYKDASKPNKHAASVGILMTKLYRSTIFIPQILRWTLRDPTRPALLAVGRSSAVDLRLQ